MFSAGCLTGNNEETKIAPPSGGNVQSAGNIPLDQVAVPAPPGDFVQFYPGDIAQFNLKAIPVNPLSLETEVPDTNWAQFIDSKFGVLYINPSTTTNAYVVYEIYKMKSDAYAQQALGVYTKNWNKNVYNASYKNIWIWEGFKEGAGYPRGANIYYDTSSRIAHMNTNPESLPVISTFGQDLACLHGEAAFGEYFIMADVHLPSNQVGTTGYQIYDSLFSQVQSEYSGVATDSTSSGEVYSSREEELTDLQEKLEWAQANNYPELADKINLRIDQLNSPEEELKDLQEKLEWAETNNYPELADEIKEKINQLNQTE